MASPQSTLPNDEKEAQDSAHNPGEKAYQNAGLDQLESFANDPKNHGANDDIRDAEENPDDTSLSGGLYTPSAGGKKERTKITFRGVVRSKGAIGGIIALVFGTGLGFSALLSPSLLIIHTKEIMVQKFDTQLTSMDARSGKILNTQISGATSGLCSSVVTIKCRFSTMSETQVKNFADAGIGVEPSKPNAGTRTKPTSYTWKGNRITASDFARLSNSDEDFKIALKKAYNPKYAGLAGQAWDKAAKFLGISKKAPDIEGDTDAERLKKLNEIAKDGEAPSAKRSPSEFETKECDATCAQNEADTLNNTASDLESDGTSGEAAAKATGLLGDGPVSGAVAATKVTGIVDGYCQAYGAINAVGLAAKTVRAVQEARYVMVFWTAADELKATGGLSSETASFLGKTLTTVTKDAKGNILSGSGTDSFGYGYVARGDTTASKRSLNIANRFLAGGGFTGDLINFSNTVESFFPGGRQGAKNTCGVLANPVVGGLSLAAGVASLFIPGANVVKIVAGGAAGAAIGLGLQLLPALLSDIIGGTTTSNLVGEASFDAQTAGGGKILSDAVPGLNGNGLMNKTDAAAYLGAQAETAAAYGKDESLALSPLDPTNQYTFMGSIVSKLLPIAGSINDGSTLLSSFGSLLSTSFASIVPTSNALTTQQYNDSLNVCQDQDSTEAGYATDPFCNVIRGIPLQYLNKDPNTVVDELVASGDLDPTTELPTAQYQAFINKCIDTTDSPGYTSTDATGFDLQGAKDCIINDSNANKFLNYLDTRVASEMEGTDTSTSNTDATDKKALAQKIVDKHNVTYLGDVEPKLEDIASGKVDGDAEPCGVNINILKIIDAITDKYPIKISSMNRLCKQSVPNGSSPSSRHYDGNGSAVDIAVIDGHATHGRDAVALEAIGIAMPILSAVANGNHSSIGQAECGNTPALSAGVVTFNDACSHIHFDVPPQSDPNLKYIK